MVKIKIDGKYYEVKPEKNLLETCLALGIDIPHFCFHPALGSGIKMIQRAHSNVLHGTCDGRSDYFS